MGDETKGCSRREFFTRTISGVATAGLLGYPGKALSEQPEKKIIYRTLGKTGIKVPVVSMGVMNADNPELVRRSYELGIRLFDTAAYYQRGRNEEMLGGMIKEMGVRDDVVIVTKVLIPSQRMGLAADAAEKAFLDLFEGSLKRLGMNAVDVIHLHNAEGAGDLDNPGIKKAMLSIKNQKLAKFIGFTTHTNMVECLDAAAASGFFDVILTSINYSMFDDKVLLKSMENAAAKGIGLIAMKTQCKQPWYRKYESKKGQSFYDGPINHAALLKWVLRHEFITTAVPGYVNFEELEEDFAVVRDLEYTSAEKQFLEDRNVKLSMQGICRQCGECLASCPKGVDIPSLMRVHMYAACYSNLYHARATLEEVTAENGLAACSTCDTCTAACVRRVDIAGRIDELKTIYA
jgi:predicted aldo/keto reductase-like oxidoreductase